MDNNRGEYKAIIIAADRYKQANDLPNTLNDAREIKKLLTEEPSHFKEENVQYYHGNLVTKAVLEASLTSFFTKAKSEDILFLFWAGHGGQMNGEGYFIPYEAENDVATLISMQYVRNLIDNTKAKAVLSFFDTCHSGAVARNTHTMLTRGMDISGEGKILIAACLPEQTAKDRNGHGAFTDYLIKGLQGEAASSNGDIDIYNLYSYISRQLQTEFSDSSQLPLMKSTISGAPIVLKRTSNRQASKTSDSKESYTITSSGNYLLLGQLITKYDEYKETNTDIHLLLKELSNAEEIEIRKMRNTKQPFAIRNEAHMVNVRSVELTERQGVIYCSVLLQVEKKNSNWVLDDMSYQENGRKMTATDIAKLRIDRFIGIESKETFPKYGGGMIESAVLNPTNSPIKVKVGLIQSLLSQDFNFEQVRLVLISSLILTRTLTEIDKLELSIESNDLVEVKIAGYRPKFYNNMPAERIDVTRRIDKV